MTTFLSMLYLAIVTLYQCNPIYRLRARIILLTYQVEAERLRADRLAAQLLTADEALWQAELKLADDRWYKFDNEQLKAQLTHYEAIRAAAMMRVQMVDTDENLTMKVMDLP